MSPKYCPVRRMTMCESCNTSLGELFELGNGGRNVGTIQYVITRQACPNGEPKESQQGSEGNGGRIRTMVEVNFNKIIIIVMLLKMETYYYTTCYGDECMHAIGLSIGISSTTISLQSLYLKIFSAYFCQSLSVF